MTTWLKRFSIESSTGRGDGVGMQKRATIVDVAKLAGVSIGTVSRVLNSSSGPDATRRKVLEAVDELDYVANHVARSLKRRATEQLAFVVPDIGNPVYVAMATAVQQEAKERGYRLTLISSDVAPGNEDVALESLEQRRVDGVIMCSLTPTAALVERLTGLRDRVCVVGRLPEGVPVDNVRVDSEGGAQLAVQHLLDGGRRAVGFINGTAGTVPAEARATGYRRALEENGHDVDEALVASGSFTMAGGYHAVDPLLEANPDLDAIFCANDVIALGALRRLQERGLGVPDRVALAGVDDIELGRISTPTLTTVSLRSEERGRLAAEMLLDRIEDEASDEPRRVTVTPRLVVRESSTDYVVRGARA